MPAAAVVVVVVVVVQVVVVAVQQRRRCSRHGHTHIYTHTRVSALAIRIDSLRRCWTWRERERMRGGLGLGGDRSGAAIPASVHVSLPAPLTWLSLLIGLVYVQVITPSRNLVLCADSRRDMEEWISALKMAANKEYYEVSSVLYFIIHFSFSFFVSLNNKYCCKDHLLFFPTYNFSAASVHYLKFMVCVVTVRVTKKDFCHSIQLSSRFLPTP